MKKNIAFIINPISGVSSKENIAETIEQIIDKEQYGECEICYTRHKGHASELAQLFVGRGFHVVVAVGGDGTVNEVARALVHTSAVLGVISTGSGNGLARHLKIPLNAKKAVEQLNFSEAIKMDYGLVNNKYPFFGTCGTGFDAYVSELFAKGTKRGVIGYVEKMVTGYLNYELQQYRLIGNDVNLNGNAFVVTFANASQWGNNAYIAPNASVQDGLMDISIISNVPVIAIPAIAFQLFTKTIRQGLLVSTLRTNEITLYRNESGPFHLDGDAYDMGKEIHIKIVPGGLNVLVRKRF